VVTEVHTEAGRHELQSVSWKDWAALMNVTPLESVSDAKQIIEDAVRRLGAGEKVLPWKR
jgi:hypothetical protein